jgi:hypothetical protein
MRRLLCAHVIGLLCFGLLSITPHTVRAIEPQTAPAAVVDSGWVVPTSKTNVLEASEANGRQVVRAAQKQLVMATREKLAPDTKVRIEFRFTSALRTSLSLSTGLADANNARERGLYVNVTPSSNAVSWTVFDPNSKARQPQVNGVYRPQYEVARSLAWPESLRANVEADMVASKPLSDRWLALEMTLRPHGYDVSLDGIPLARVNDESINTAGMARITVTSGVEIARVHTEPAPSADAAWIYQPVPLDSVLNAAKIDGQAVDRETLAQSPAVKQAKVPFVFAQPNADGNDHLDVGTSWFRQGNLDGRYSGRGTDAMIARWAGSLVKDPARLCLRLPMARYRALHLIAASDSDADSMPVVTAQFYREQAGFPKSFAARVPAFAATSSDAREIPVKTRDGRSGKLYHVTIPIDPGALAEFDDLAFIDVELTKEVQLYRAAPDPMYYSTHAAGLPSSVHVYALTAERPAVDVSFAASAYGHVWTAPETPEYTATVTNRHGAAREIQLELTTTSLDGKQTTRQAKTIRLAPAEQSTVTWPLKLAAFGYHDVQLKVTDGEQTWIEPRSLAYLQPDTRVRGDWDFGRGPLFGFWNWGGGHVTPSADKQLLVMAKAGIETTPGSFEEYVQRHGEATRQIMEQYKIFTLKFAGAGDHYVTANFATDLKKDGLEIAREKFLKALNLRKSTPGPHSRPLFLSFYPEPSIGPVTHGIFPEYIGEPKHEFTDYERERYEYFLNGFLQGAKIVKENFPDVKCLLPHGDPAFVVHFLRGNPEVAKLLDGVTVDIPCFERLPEQQFHQVALHRLYMARKEMADAGVKKPLLPMYEGPCVPSGPGALTNQEQADLTIRDSLMLMAYGIDIQNGGFPAFDTASYWGEQHYGFGVLNRVSLETPKPAYAALATLTRHLNRANFHKWVPTGSHSVYALQFKHWQSGKLVHVLWTLRGKRPVTLDVPADADVAIFDQMDNPRDMWRRGSKVVFTLDQSPCYVEGLTADAVISLGEPDHSDTAPGEHAKKLANFDDGRWKIAIKPEREYEESHTPYIYRYPSPMTAKSAAAQTAQGGMALAVHFKKPETDRVFVPYYSVLTPSTPIAIPGKASHLGVWVKGASDWGRVVYFVRDAKGEQWISIGTRGAWNCDDLHSWTSFNFDGWRYLRMELPANSPYDQFREQGRVWWGPYSSGDGNVDLPLTLEKVVIERRTHVMYVNDPQPANPSDVLLGDLFAEYAQAADATPEAIRLAAVRMSVPHDVKGLENPIAKLRVDGQSPAISIERITLPNQEADGTQCFVHFAKVDGAQSYDIWASPYPDGRGALQLGKAWKEPGQQIRGLRPNQDFYLFLVYTDSAGKLSQPSAPFKINLQDFFGMK